MRKTAVTWYTLPMSYTALLVGAVIGSILGTMAAYAPGPGRIAILALCGALAAGLAVLWLRADEG